MNPYYNYQNNNDGDRFFPVAPFLFGALAGGAVVSLSRPRPVMIYPAYPNYPMPYSYNYSNYYNYRPY